MKQNSHINPAQILLILSKCADSFVRTRELLCPPAILGQRSVHQPRALTAPHPPIHSSHNLLHHQAAVPSEFLRTLPSTATTARSFEPTPPPSAHAHQPSVRVRCVPRAPGVP